MKPTDAQAAYVTELAAQLLTAETEIAAEHGEHMRPGRFVTRTDPETGKTAVGFVQSVYRREDGTAAADVELVGAPSGSVPAAELGPTS
ncbi:hypothetical protein QQY66_49055 [Streptomyces sp. DG2A-72]|uniref:hypothetical protein n=1 Tax=Streptomyces sp. DG2A-72 TaxID=3051386 RepID=UPI00265BB91A|nr:hypothetical protein [Streptomyces sp. DG2A-72]MDO0939263.1 hypothetical protein [Streptomyces sp. DG2A-72]